MHDHEGENEETAHYAQTYFCDEEPIYDTGCPAGNRALRETHSRDGVNYSTEEHRGSKVCQLCC